MPNLLRYGDKGKRNDYAWIAKHVEIVPDSLDNVITGDYYEMPESSQSLQKPRWANS